MEFLLQPLTLLTFFPLVGIIILIFIPGERKDALRERYRGLTPEQRQSLRDRRLRQPLPGGQSPGPR